MIDKRSKGMLSLTLLCDTNWAILCDIHMINGLTIPGWLILYMVNIVKGEFAKNLSHRTYDLSIFKNEQVAYKYMFT